MPTEYKLTDKQFDRIKAASKGVRETPVMMVGGVDLSGSARRDLDRAWAEVAKAHGVKVHTIKPSSTSERHFMAEPAA